MSAMCDRHPANPAWNCPDCEADALPAQDAARHADLVRRQVRHVRTTRPATTPEATDLAATRARADRETAT